MARVSKTSYFCDGCSKEVERARDLTHFDIANHGRAGRGAYYPRTSTQLCDECTALFLDGVKTWGFDVELLGNEE